MVNSYRRYALCDSRNCALLLGVSFIVAACADVRDYPRCYLFREPIQSDVTAANESTSDVLKKVVGTSRFALGKDSVSVKAIKSQQTHVSSIWPQLGCVNLRRPDPYTGEIVDKWIVARCQEYLKEVVAKDNKKPTESLTKIAEKYDDFTCH